MGFWFRFSSTFIGSAAGALIGRWLAAHIGIGPAIPLPIAFAGVIGGTVTYLWWNRKR